MSRPLCALLLCALLWLTAGAAALEAPKRPTFLRVPHFVTERDDIHVEIQIEPHELNRWVRLDAYEADVDEALGMWRRGIFTGRSSGEEITDQKRTIRTYRFAWRSGVLRAGKYLLVAKVVWVYGLTRERETYLEVLE